MNIMETIKNLFSGNLEGKLGELLSGLIEKIKPLIAEGKISDLLAAAVENFGDLGQKLKEVLAKLTGAAGEEKETLINEKNELVSQVKVKGGELVDAAQQEEALPDALKGLVAKAGKLLGKL